MIADTYALYRQPYFDTRNQCYRNIITISAEPKGPLASIVRRINTASLGRDNIAPTCCYAITSLKTRGELLLFEELPNLFTFLLSNGYKIDTSLTKMLNTSDIRIRTGNNLIAFVLYNS